MSKFFNVQRMLRLANFRYYMQTGISAELFVCFHCLPLVVSEGIDFQEQCADSLLTGHVFVDNDLMADHTFQPRRHPQICDNCGERVLSWKLRVELSELEYVSDRERVSKQLDWTGWNDEIQVEMLGKRGWIVGQLGYDLSRPWIAWYTIMFEDGTRIDAKSWQFKVVQ